MKLLRRPLIPKKAEKTSLAAGQLPMGGGWPAAKRIRRVSNTDAV